MSLRVARAIDRTLPALRSGMSSKDEILELFDISLQKVNESLTQARDGEGHLAADNLTFALVKLKQLREMIVSQE